MAEIYDPAEARQDILESWRDGLDLLDVYRLGYTDNAVDIVASIGKLEAASKKVERPREYDRLILDAIQHLTPSVWIENLRDWTETYVQGELEHREAAEVFRNIFDELLDAAIIAEAAPVARYADFIAAVTRCIEALEEEPAPFAVPRFYIERVMELIRNPSLLVKRIFDALRVTFQEFDEWETEGCGKEIPELKGARW